MSHRAAAALTVSFLSVRDAVVARLRDERGQGTVEYVALILLVAAVMAAVVVWSKDHGQANGDAISKKITDQIKGSIDSVGASTAPAGKK